MKKSITIALFVGACIAFSSCLKGVGNNPARPAIAGNWSLANDSTTIEFWGLWQGKPDTGINYVGTSVDHYNFMQNGTVYIKEGNTLDTGTYTINPNNKIEIKFNYLNGQGNPPNGWTEDFTYSNLSGHTLTLTGGTFVSPETATTHILHLTK